MTNIVDVVVVGGGAAGIIAAGRAAQMGKKALLLEKNDRLGMKILISGGGKCNLTHDGSMEELRAKFRPTEARFLKPSFYKFTNEQFLFLLHERGMATYVRPDGRVFPVEPADAKTVVRLLTDYVLSSGVDICYHCPVTRVIIENGAVKGVEAGGDVFEARSLIIASGGSSYPATGTTGDGWRWLKEFGHTITPITAALAPISIEEPRSDWSGVALRGVQLKARIGEKGKEFARWTGDVLYTHKGISGPAALGISREVAERLTAAPEHVPYLVVDLVPGTAYEHVRERLRQDATDHPRKALSQIFAGFLPSRLIGTLFDLADVNPELRGAQFPAKMLTKLVTLLKEWPIGRVSAVPIERGEVVAGGVSTEEVDPQTMQSKMIAGLYLCGEILDVAGPVGGYNLQAAWSTGYVAGTYAGGGIH